MCVFVTLNPRRTPFDLYPKLKFNRIKLDFGCHSIRALGNPYRLHIVLLRSDSSLCTLVFS